MALSTFHPSLASVRAVEGKGADALSGEERREGQQTRAAMKWTAAISAPNATR
jgi:hypothetical protein